MAPWADIVRDDGLVKEVALRVKAVSKELPHKFWYIDWYAGHPYERSVDVVAKPGKE